MMMGSLQSKSCMNPKSHPPSHQTLFLGWVPCPCPEFVMVGVQTPLR